MKLLLGPGERLSGGLHAALGLRPLQTWDPGSKHPARFARLNGQNKRGVVIVCCGLDRAKCRLYHGSLGINPQQASLNGCSTEASWNLLLRLDDRSPRWVVRMTSKHVSGMCLPSAQLGLILGQLDQSSISTESIESAAPERGPARHRSTSICCPVRRHDQARRLPPYDLLSRTGNDRRDDRNQTCSNGTISSIKPPIIVLLCIWDSWCAELLRTAPGCGGGPRRGSVEIGDWRDRSARTEGALAAISEQWFAEPSAPRWPELG